MRRYGRREFLRSTAAVASTLVARSGQASAPGRARQPNVLWLMTDEQRCDSLGCYGSTWAETPALDRLAGEGVLFRHAVTPSPVCVPARVSLLSGQSPLRTQVFSNSDAPRPNQQFLLEIFAQHDYQTCSVGKHHYNSAHKLFEVQKQRMLPDAVDYMNYRKGRNYRDYDAVRYPNNPWHWILAGRFPESEDKTSSALDVTDALAWCQQMDRGRPFFLRVSFNDPHTPVVAPAPFDTAIDPERILVPGPDHLPAGAPAWERDGLSAVASSEPLSPAQITRMRQCYYGLVKFVDHEVARLLEGMKGMGLLENTIVVMCADHGTHLGDHGLVQKSSFYEPVVHVPYFIRWPGEIAKGAVIDQPVSTISLLPTLLDLCGLPVPGGLDGHSLAGTLRSGRALAPQPVFSEIIQVIWGMRRVVLVRDGVWKLAVARWPDWPAGTPCPFGALYNLDRDPHEEHNLYGAPETADIEKRLLALIETRDATNAEAYR